MPRSADPKFLPNAETRPAALAIVGTLTAGQNVLQLDSEYATSMCRAFKTRRNFFSICSAGEGATAS